MALSLPATCDAISQELSQETGRYASKMYQTHFSENPWVGAVPQEPWEDGLGFTPQTLIRERTLPTTRAAWVAITSADSCDPPIDIVPNAWTNRSFSRLHKEFASDWLCVNEIRASVQAAQQIDMMIQNMDEVIAREWMLQKRQWYFDNCAHKIVLVGGEPESSGATFPAVQPDSALTKGILDKCYLHTSRDGGFNNGGSLGRTDMMRPVATVIASPEAIDGVIKLNDDIRQDVRWSTEANLLLQGFNAFKSYGNYAFLTDTMPMRFNWNGSGFTQVPEYVNQAASVGQSAELNPAYLVAQFEVTFMFNPLVYHCLIPSPAFSVGQAKFEPHNYMGELWFDNGYDQFCNHLRNKGKFRGLLSAAPKPIQPRYGYSILHLRCGTDNTSIACPTHAGYGY